MGRRVVLFVVGALALALPAAAWAQGKPDFSGTWKLEKSEPAGYKGSGGLAGVTYSMGRGWGAHAPTVVIKQTANELTLESAQFGEDPPRRVVYKLDGSEMVTDDPQHPGFSTFKWKTKVRWDGANLVLFSYHGWTNMVDTLSLSGGKLTIRREVSGQYGGGAGETETGVPHMLVYAKTS